MNKKIKDIISKQYNNFSTQLVPVSYINSNLINDFNENIIKTKPMEEIGYVKFDVFTYMSDKKDDDIITTLNDGDIIPFVHFAMYMPLRFKKMVVDSKNVLTLSYINYDFVSIYFQEYVKVLNSFKTPNITNEEKEFLSNEVKSLGEKLFVESKLMEQIEEQIKKIIETEDFKNFDFSIVPSEFDYDNFLSIPNTNNNNNELSINSKLDIKNKKQFLNIVKKMFLV